MFYGLRAITIRTRIRVRVGSLTVRPCPAHERGHPRIMAVRPADCGECTTYASQLRPHTDRDPDNVGTGHELAKAYDIGKLLLIDPLLLLDGDAARPDDSPAEAAERDDEERSEQRCERNGPRQFHARNSDYARLLRKYA